ncbi:glycosyltransferase [Luteolibacter sp. LG18]|uniref:glycosyltransferase n=1 Tax=Luteolibacter sp. LG18 TaxID=2819286 RepID=UPI002B3074BE|nr:rhamnosyltransferase [Luteolibacter sp. LG18]
MPELPESVSVVMRCKDEAWAVGDTLRMLKDQDYPGTIQLVVIDSGSTDGSVEIIRAAGPDKLIEIQPHEYIPGVVMNRGARECDHEWIVYLNADATPANRQWLRELLLPCLQAPAFGAGFSRQIPRPDCQAVFAHDYDRCFGPERESKHWGHFFSMVSSITRRSVLEKEPFREDLQYAEDDEWTRRLLAKGYQVIFAEESVAIHSHNYTLKQCFKRSFGDAKAMAATSTTHPSDVNLHYFVALGWARDFLKDVKWCLKNGHLTGIPRAAAVRLSQRLGRRKGHHVGWKHYHRDQNPPAPREA